MSRQEDIYECLECKGKFWERETHYYTGGNGQEVACCPHCKSADIVRLVPKSEPKNVPTREVKNE